MNTVQSSGGFWTQIEHNVGHNLYYANCTIVLTSAEKNSHKRHHVPFFLAFVPRRVYRTKPNSLQIAISIGKNWIHMRVHKLLPRSSYHTVNIKIWIEGLLSCKYPELVMQGYGNNEHTLYYVGQAYKAMCMATWMAPCCRYIDITRQTT